VAESISIVFMELMAVANRLNAKCVIANIQSESLRVHRHQESQQIEIF
jgi:hypothetical protein